MDKPQPLIPQPFRAIVQILTVIGIAAFIFGVKENIIELIVVGIVLAVIFGAMWFMWGIPDIK